MERAKRTIENRMECPCDICGRVLSKRSSLRRHLLTHTDERPYACEICNRAFRGGGELKRHYRVHTDERPHGCQACGQRFKQKYHLTKHRRSYHSKQHLERNHITYVRTSAQFGFLF